MSIKTYGEIVLREKAAPVSEFDEELEKTVVEMKKTLEEKKGVGLAANQVGIPMHFFIARLTVEGEAVAYVNPVLAPLSGELVKNEEGCLSIPGIWVEVERYLKVKLRAQDVRGKPVELDLEGFPARVVQHEVDHLNGVLIIDRISLKERRRIAKELIELKEKP